MRGDEEYIVRIDAPDPNHEVTHSHRADRQERKYTGCWHDMMSTTHLHDHLRDINNDGSAQENTD